MWWLNSGGKFELPLGLEDCYQELFVTWDAYSLAAGLTPEMAVGWCPNFGARSRQLLAL